MALFKILRGPSSGLDKLAINDGWCYYTPDTGLFYIDYNGTRVPLNAKDAQTLSGASLVQTLNNKGLDKEILSAAAVDGIKNNLELLIAAKQEHITGNEGQVVVIGANGNPTVIDASLFTAGGVINQNTSETIKIWRGTKAEYNALETKSDDIMYIITDNSPFVPEDKPYLTFNSPNSFTLAVGDATKHWDGTLEYSTDETTWSTWDGTTTLSSVDNDGEHVLYLRGTGNTKICYYDENMEQPIPWAINGANVRCDGNIENLLDYALVKAGQHPTMAKGCFIALFMECAALITPPELPAITLAEKCYYGMFANCTSLTQAPALPATMLANNCYNAMFAYCTSLTKAPALPATTLTEGCYSSMFGGCTGLAQAPELPATTLANDCYFYMFSGCTSLTQAPTLPATTLADSCYYYMFDSCIGLSKAPALPATTMATNCYYSMFNGCTNLAQAPALPATTLAERCYEGMFHDCTSLTQAPALPATTLADCCYMNMFKGCTGLAQAPALLATTLTERCYYMMFESCTSLTQAPALPATTLANNCYNNMFWGCTSLTQAPALPATTLAVGCYTNMFNGCISLTQAPKLPATTLTDFCYASMFQNCASLKLSSIQTGEYAQEYRIPITGTGTTATNALAHMFLRTGGTFTGTPEINTTYYLSTDNMIVRDTEIATLNGYVSSMIDGPLKPEDKPYLTFNSPNSFTLAVGDATKHWDGTLEYSTDETTWSTWDGTTTLSSVDNDGEYVLYLRGTGNTVIGYHTATTGTYITWVINGTDVRCNGNIETLLDYVTVEAGQHPAMAAECFYALFMGCTALTVAPTLPATTLADYCYSHIFQGCTSLTQAPTLPSTTLTEGCYYCMFQGCTGLTQAPTLPATTLVSNCYQAMFQGCTGLTQAPTLPANTLANSCYDSMFRDCAGLTQAPALPATTLANYCYDSMFRNCTSLTQAPALPATTLATYCYRHTFSGCTGLTQAPALPATTLASNCYYYMFYGCTGLTQAPALPATTLAERCYYHMFGNCTGLTQAPALPATTLAAGCYYRMFSACTSLTQAPPLPATTLANDCYHSMFRDCAGLTQAPALPATTLADYCYSDMFRSCTSLKLSSTQTGEYTQEYRIPSSGAGMTATNALTDMFTNTGGTFTGIPEINTTYYLSTDNMIVRDTEVSTLNGYVESMIDANSEFKPEGKSYLTFSSPNSFTLAAGNATKYWDGTLEYFAADKAWTAWDGTTTLSSVDNDGEYVLYLRGTGNTVITGSSNYRWVLTGSDISCIGNIENLLDYATVESGSHPIMTKYCYNYMFQGCTSLIQAPALPATTLAIYCYNYMFYGCTNLTQAPALPATTLASGCYQSMFEGCTSLNQAPELPATTLANNCYESMFNGCTSLTQAPELPSTTLANLCYQSMFSGCTSLTHAPVLPATTLKQQCYSNMFHGCTSLTQAPALPAKMIMNYCYSGMFYGCTSLKFSSTQTDEYTQEYHIPSSGTGTTATNALADMFTETGGTFTGTPEINTTYYLSTDNMIVRETDIATLNGYVGSMIDAKSNASSIIEQNKGLAQKFWRGTTAEYEALSTKSDDTMYIITDTEEIAQATYMPMNVYDPQSKAQDIFAYTDNSVQVHATNTNIHVTSDEKAAWNAKLDSSAVPAWAKAANKPTYTASEVGAVPVSGATMTGALIAQNNSNLTTKQVRNIIISTSEPTTSDGNVGDIWIVYEA